MLKLGVTRKVVHSTMHPPLMYSAEYMKTLEESSIYDCKYLGIEWNPSASLAVSSKRMYLLHIEMFERRFKRQEKKEEKK